MDPLLELTIALSLAALFAGSALHQLRAWNEWHGIVRNYRLLPHRLAGAGAIAISLSEVLAAAALLWPPARSAGGVGVAALLAVFSMALAINIGRGRTQIDCGCLGSSLRSALSPSLSPWMVVRNGVLVAFALSLMLPPTPRELSWFEVAASVASVITLAFLYPVLNLVLALRAAGLRARAAG